jgi:hypothetical protein
VGNVIPISTWLNTSVSAVMVFGENIVKNVTIALPSHVKIKPNV